MEGEQQIVIDHLGEIGFPSNVVWKYIREHSGANRIEAFLRKYHQDGYTLYQLELENNGFGVYEPKGYHAYLIKVPQMPHGIYNGVDSFQLEKKFKAMDWDFVQRTGQDSGSGVSELFWSLRVLRNTGKKDAITIADWLTKFYIAAHFDQDIISNSHYFEIRSDQSDFHIREAFNLLSGRAVVKFLAAIDKPCNFYFRWAYLRDGQLVYTPHFNLGETLRKYFIEEAVHGPSKELLYHFIRGERLVAHTTINGQRTPVYIEADPAANGLRFFDLKGSRLQLTLTPAGLLAGEALVKEPLPAKKAGNGKQGKKNSM